MRLAIAGAIAACGLAIAWPAASPAQDADAPAGAPPALREDDAAVPPDPDAAAQSTVISGVDMEAASAAEAAAEETETARADASEADVVEDASDTAEAASPETDAADAAAAETSETDETETAETEPAETAAESADAAASEQILAEARTAALASAADPGAIDDPLVAMAADYVLFQRDLAAIQDRPIEEPVDLDAVMDTLASYNSEVLSDAWLAYAAFIAAQNPVFVDKVREVAAYYGAAELLQGMVNEPEYVLGFDGAREAAARVLDVLRQDASRLTAMSGRFKQESYDLQTRGWSNLIARDRDERLSGLVSPQRITRPSQDLLASVAYGAPITSAESAEIAQQRRAAFWSAVAYRPEPPAAAPAQTPNAEALGVMMTLGAMRALGATAERPDLVTHLLNVPDTKACFDFALLHLRQCIAAARFKYEDAFCIAEHQLQDFGECLGETLEPARPRRPMSTPAEAAAPGSDGPATYPSLTPAPAPADAAALAAATAAN